MVTGSASTGWTNEDGLRRLGRRSWSVVGIAAAAAVIAWVIGALAGVAIPLVVAAVMGVLLHPVVDRLERVRCPRSIGAALVLLALGTLLVVSIWLTVVGVIDQSDQISAEITRGLQYLDEEFSGLWDPPGGSASAESGLADAIPNMFGGVTSWFGSVFSSIAAFLVGTAIAVFFLYYVLLDWQQLSGWLGTHLGVEPELGHQFVEDATASIRAYFGALTVSSLVTAVVIGVTAAILDVPLAMSIALVTFVTSYVPYLGAIFSGAFAVLIALGSAGTREAVILLITVLVVQNVVQTLMLTKLSSDRLRLHPIVNLGSTIVGAAIAGLLGATLSAPTVAIIVLVRRRLVEQRDRDDEVASPEGAR